MAERVFDILFAQFVNGLTLRAGILRFKFDFDFF